MLIDNRYLNVNIRANTRFMLHLLRMFFFFFYELNEMKFMLIIL